MMKNVLKQSYALYALLVSSEEVQYLQLGDELPGFNEDYSVCSMSSDGTTVVVGTPYNDGNEVNSGHVQVHAYNGSQWNQVGDDMYGESAGVQSGYAVSISDNGNIIAIEKRYNGTGQVRVYSYDGSLWDRGWGLFGFAISTSPNGMLVAIGMPRNHGDDNQGGQVAVYSFDGSE